jgi:hypothetical protein
MLATAQEGLYDPGIKVRFGSATVDYSYTDITGLTRHIRLQVRVPAVSGTLPLVVWSPGGDPGDDPASALANWSETTAGAGYLTATVQHTVRDESSKQALCKALEVPEDLCASANAGDWDRAQDLQKLLAAVETFNQAGPAEIRGRIDLSRIAVAGFAEGATAAISIAGATRMITPAASRLAPDIVMSSRPIAFVTISPANPSKEGLYDQDTGQPTHSWQRIDRPVLSLTGAGDNDCQGAAGCQIGGVPSLRLIPFDLMPPGGKFELFLKSVDASHEFFGSLDTAQCAGEGVEEEHCTMHAAWLRSTVLAFLDATVRKLEPAQSWLKSEVPAAAPVAWRSK